MSTPDQVASAQRAPEGAMQQLLEMGFTAARAEAALSSASGDLVAAVGLLAADCGDASSLRPAPTLAERAAVERAVARHQQAQIDRDPVHRSSGVAQLLAEVRVVHEMKSAAAVRLQVAARGRQAPEHEGPPRAADESRLHLWRG